MKSFNKSKKIKGATKGKWVLCFYVYYFEVYIAIKKKHKTISYNKNLI